MNIFVLDWDVEKCARYHNDKHVVKMILETAQLLCGVHHMTDQANDQVPYRLSHKNHPCSIWARKSLTNYLYLAELGLELCKEYTFRYGKHHASERLVGALSKVPENIANVGFIDPPQCMPDYCKGDDTVIAYRTYYILEKMRFAKWKKRPMPEWFNGEGAVLGVYGKTIEGGSVSA